MNMRKNKEISKPNLVLCEGADATYFTIEYINYLNIKEEMAFNNFQVMDFGGNDELPNFLEVLPSLRNYNTVKSIIIIRDAELNHNASVQSIKSTLKNKGYPLPTKANEIACDKELKIAFLLFPT